MLRLHIKNKGKTLLIGVTGHRDLLPSDWQVQLDETGKAVADGYLMPLVKRKLEALQQAHAGKRLLLLNGMAEGADILVALVARQLDTPIPFIAILAADPETHLNSLRSKTDQVLCRQLLADAHHTVVCQTDSDTNNYREVGITIARYADELLALWNGVDTGKPGGTWEVVRMARTARDMTGRRLKLFRGQRKTRFRLHHLLTPRINSPYPLPRFFNLTSLQSLLPLGTDYSWIELSGERKAKPEKNIQAFLIEHRNEILKPFIPFVLFCLTMYFGTAGILDYQQFVETNPDSHLAAKDFHHYSFWAAFYKALHFETVFPPSFDAEASTAAPDKTVWRYLLGKYLGMVFYLYAGVLIAIRLMGDMARRVWIQLSSWVGQPFRLILGLNEQSYSSLTNLRAQRERVVALEPKIRSTYYKSSQQKGAIVIEATPEDPAQLRAVRFYRAKEIFLLGDNDSANLHMTQQMDRMLIERGHASARSDWYIQVKDTDKRHFISRFTHKLPNVHIYPFNLYENVARRLLVQYPIDRFYRNPQTDATHIFILGFSELGRQIAQNCLKWGHFKEGRKLNLNIFTTNPIEEQEKWNRQYPFLERMAAPFVSGKLAGELSDEVFGHLSVRFHSLPQTDFELLSDTFPLYEVIQPGQIVSLYACLSDEFKSAAYLSGLLERLNVLQKQQTDKKLRLTDVQVFCYYNFPNEEEIALVEQRFNELAPHVPVVCFGSFQQECSASSLRGRALDKMAQLTALYYDEVIEQQQIWQPQTDAQGIMQRAIDAWPARLEIDKESNRLFADHAFTKLRDVWEQLPPRTRQTSDDITLTTAHYLRKWVATDDRARHAMSSLEHRRWCAEKLVDGWVPLLTDEHEIEQCANLWKNDNDFKRLARSQKRHLDLVPDRVLDTLLKQEYHKDTRFIEGIPVIMEVLRVQANVENG